MLIRFLLLSGILCFAGAAPADVIIYDHFNDGVLDPAWEVVFGDLACGWTAVEEESSLYVTEICHDGAALEWANVILKQPCVLPGDFNVNWRMTWSSLNSTGTMQKLYLILRNAEGQWLAAGGYSDPWALYCGEIYMQVAGSDSYSPGPSMNFDGTAHFIFNRVDGVITCKYNGETVLEAPESSLVASVELMFGRTNYGGNENICESVGFIQCIDHAAIAGVDDVGPAHPPRVEIYPNPFNPQTRITFHTDQSQRVGVAVYDIRGGQVAELTDQWYEMGKHSVVWRGRDASGRAVPAGEYFFRVKMGGVVETRKVMLVR